MTPDDAQKILLALAGAYPATRLDEASVLVYADALRAESFEVAMAATVRLVREDRTFPPLSRLTQAIRAEERRRGQASERPWMLTEGAAEIRERGKRNVAKVRQKLDQAKRQPSLYDAHRVA